MEHTYPCVLYDTVSHTIISFGVVELTPAERIARNTKRKELIQAYADACVKEAHRMIPVTERLPNIDEEVIGYNPDGYNINWLESGENGLEWGDCWDEPTHWLPLPPAPQE